MLTRKKSDGDGRAPIKKRTRPLPFKLSRNPLFDADYTEGIEADAEQTPMHAEEKLTRNNKSGCTVDTSKSTEPSAGAAADEIQVELGPTDEELTIADAEVPKGSKCQDTDDEEAAGNQAEQKAIGRVMTNEWNDPDQCAPLSEVERAINDMLQQIPEDADDDWRLAECCGIVTKYDIEEWEIYEPIKAYESQRPFSSPLTVDQIVEGVECALRRREDARAARNVDMLNPSQLEEFDQDFDYLIPGIIPVAQVMTVSGGKNHLKTKIGLDATVSLATGTNFLNYFPVPNPVNCGIIAAEDSQGAISEALVRICRAKQVDPDLLDGRLFISTRVPQLRSESWFEEMREFIDQCGLANLWIEGAFLGLAGADQRSLQAMGAALAPTKQLSDDTRCTIELALHHKIASSSRWPRLGDISGVGFEELARSWMILNSRRGWDPATGQHYLRLVTGNKHREDRYYLHVREGHANDAGGRVWEPIVSKPDEQAADERFGGGGVKARSAAQLGKYSKDALDVLKQHPDGLTFSAIGSRAGIPEKRRTEVIATLLNSREIEEAKVKISNQKTLKPGYKIRQLS